jgi:hypothetical protein
LNEENREIIIKQINRDKNISRMKGLGREAKQGENLANKRGKGRAETRKEVRKIGWKQIDTT